MPPDLLLTLPIRSSTIGLRGGAATLTLTEVFSVNRIIRYIPGAPALSAQLDVWRAQMAELRPWYPVVLPFLAWVFVRSYRDEQERLRLDRVDPILRPSKRLPSKRPPDA